MIKASLFLMILLTVAVGFGLRWRQERFTTNPPPRRRSILARGKAGLDRWVTAAAIGAVLTLLILGGLHWGRVLFNP